MKSWKTPTPEAVARAVANMGRPQQQRYFFERLENPNWLEPLRKKGIFSTPPVQKVEETQGTIEFQDWPALDYLARMAALAPKEVCSIILDLPDTDNPFVVRAVLRAAVVMPPDFAEQLSAKVARLLRTRFLIGAEMAGEFAVRLADAGKRRAALAVLRSILEIVPDPRPIPEELRKFNPSYRHEARTRVRTFDYESMLRRNGAQLARLIGEDFVNLLCDLLERALKLEKKGSRHKQDRKTEDYSYIWQPNISNGELSESPKKVLASAVLRAADQLSALDPEHLAVMRRILSARQYKIFERIELELISRHLDIGQSAAAEKLTDKGVFEDIGVRPEYYFLSEKAFGFVSPSHQSQILQWIEEGPDRKVLQERGTTLEQVEQQIDYWRFERLTPLRAHLPLEWQQRYESLKRKFGTPRHAQYPVIFSGAAFAMGSKSPKTEQELESLPIKDIVEFLKSWKAPARNEQLSPFGESEDGLGSVLTSMVAKKPVEFSKYLPELKEADPTYVRSALQGLENALSTVRDFEWHRVLELCSWVVSQQIDIPGRTGSIGTRDPDWSWTRQTIVSLIEKGFRQKAIPFVLRNELWQLIENFAGEEDSDRLDYRNPDSEGQDVWSSSINRVQPRAIRTAIMYIEWCRDNLAGLAFSFQLVAEAASLLRRHLDGDVDPSLDVRLIYGEFLPFLMSADARWIQENTRVIFPEELEQRSLRDVAWVAYLTANSAYDKAFEILRSQYSSAVDEIGRTRRVGPGHMLVDADEKLAQHLMQLYWRGRIGLEKGGLLDRFYKLASDRLLGRTVMYIGRSISNTKDVPEEIMRRLKSLWEYHMLRSPSPTQIREMAAFGWWFNSGHFEDHWALEHLYSSLKLSKGEMEPKLGTLQRLAKLASQYPELVISCTEIIVHAELVDVILWVDDLTNILKVVLKSGGDASRTARSIIQTLGIRGHLQYRNLLASE